MLDQRIPSTGPVRLGAAAGAEFQERYRAADADQGEAVLKAYEESNDYGTFKVAADGTWTFTLDNSKPAVQALKEGQSIDVATGL